MPAGDGRLTAEVRGEVVAEDRVLVIRRIHVVYRLKAAPEQRETAERVHGFHADFCPVARTLRGAVAITTELLIAEG